MESNSPYYLQIAIVVFREVLEIAEVGKVYLAVESELESL
jgi:hypothetical protein